MDAHTPKISVIMPVYNGLPDIKIAVKSLLWQTFQDWECIIVNDGSTDGTKDFLESLKEDSRFRITHLAKNGGRGNARQAALELVRGEYIAFLDADDWYAPEKLEEQLSFLENHPDVDLIGGAAMSYGSKTDIKRVRGKGDFIITTYNGLTDLNFVCGCAMVRTAITNGMSYNTTIDYGEDLDFFRRCLLGKNYTVGDKVWYYYNEFDSVTIPKMRKEYYKSFLQYRAPRSLFGYLFWCIIAPLIGVNTILKRRGGIPTKEEANRFNLLYNKLHIC